MYICILAGRRHKNGDDAAQMNCEPGVLCIGARGETPATWDKQIAGRQAWATSTAEQRIHYRSTTLGQLRRHSTNTADRTIVFAAKTNPMGATTRLWPPDFRRQTKEKQQQNMIPPRTVVN